MLVDGGNVFFSNMPSGKDPGQKNKQGAIILAKAMAISGADAVNVGSEDLNGGLDFLKNQLAGPEGNDPLPLISANLVYAESGEPVFPGYVIVEEGGARVGVFGVLKPGGLGESAVKALPPREAARQMAEKLRAQCDLVVGLFAMDYRTGSEIIREVPGIDVAVVSDRTASLRRNPMVLNKTLLAQAGNRGMFVGKMEIVRRAGRTGGISRQEKIKLTNEMTSLEKEISQMRTKLREEPQLRAEYHKGIRRIRELKDKLASADFDFEYSNSMVSIEPRMERDPDVAKWMDELSEPQKPAAKGKK